MGDREKLREEMVQILPGLVGLEACGGAHDRAREFQKMGDSVKLIPPSS